MAPIVVEDNEECKDWWVITATLKQSTYLCPLRCLIWHFGHKKVRFLCGDQLTFPRCFISRRPVMNPWCFRAAIQRTNVIKNDTKIGSAAGQTYLYLSCGFHVGDQGFYITYFMSHLKLNHRDLGPSHITMSSQHLETLKQQHLLLKYIFLFLAACWCSVPTSASQARK